MKFIRQNDGSLNILVSDEDDYDVTDDNGVDVILSQEQVQELKGVLCASHTITSSKRERYLLSEFGLFVADLKKKGALNSAEARWFEEKIAALRTPTEVPR